MAAPTPKALPSRGSPRSVDDDRPSETRKRSTSFGLPMTASPSPSLISSMSVSIVGSSFGLSTGEEGLGGGATTKQGRRTQKDETPAPPHLNPPTRATLPVGRTRLLGVWPVCALGLLLKPEGLCAEPPNASRAFAEPPVVAVRQWAAHPRVRARSLGRPGLGAESESGHARPHPVHDAIRRGCDICAAGGDGLLQDLDGLVVFDVAVRCRGLGSTRGVDVEPV